jgi:hypothetical protein
MICIAELIKLAPALCANQPCVPCYMKIFTRVVPLFDVMYCICFWLSGECPSCCQHATLSLQLTGDSLTATFCF